MLNHKLMNIFLWIGFGALAGWVIAAAMALDADGSLLNIFAGAIGAAIWTAA